MVRSLEPGDTGCVRKGVYVGDVVIAHKGRPGAPISIRGVPAGAPLIRGIFFVADSADDVVVRDLRLDGSNGDDLPSPQVNGDRVAFIANDVTNRHSSSCFILGGAFERYGVARDTRLIGNRIHDCGRLPATGHDHGIYVEGSDGAVINRNVIRGNADFGIHLYPRAHGSRITRNVIARNGGGIIFAGEAAGGEYAQSYASSANLVARNVITASRRAPNVDAWWGGPIGTRNRLRDNCLWPGRGGNFGGRAGFSAAGNVVVDPRLGPGRRGALTPRARRCARIIGS